MVGLTTFLAAGVLSGAANIATPDVRPVLTPEEMSALEREMSLDTADSTRGNAPTPFLGKTAPGIPQSLNPDLSLTLDVAAALFNTASPPQTGAHDPVRTGFNLQQLEWATEAVVDPFFEFKSFVVLSQFGLEVEEAYATTFALPRDLQARVGQFLTRFGRLNATHPHAWDFVDQALVLGKFFGGEGNRGLGAEISWLAPLPWYLEVVGSLSDSAGGATARSFFGNTDLGVLSPLDLQATGALKQFFPLGRDWSLAWGASGATGPNPSGPTNRTDIFGTDVYLKYRPLDPGAETAAMLTIEALLRRRQVPRALQQDTGGYSSLVWRFDRNWEAGARAEVVDGLVGDTLDPDWTRPRYRNAVALTFRPSEFSRLRLQAQADYANWLPQPVYSAVVAFESTVGAHGAHAF